MKNSNMISIKAFCKGHGISQAFIEEILEYELIEVVSQENDLFLPEEQLNQLERIKRLYFDLGINPAGIDVVLQLLQRIEQLEDTVRQLMAKHY